MLTLQPHLLGLFSLLLRKSLSHDTNSILFRINQIIKENDSIISFDFYSGNDFLRQNSFIHLRKYPLEKWSDLTKILGNFTLAGLRPLYQGIHVYNRNICIGQLLTLIKNEATIDINYTFTARQVHHAMDQSQRPIIISTYMNENWGLLSSGKSRSSSLIYVLISY